MESLFYRKTRKGLDIGGALRKLLKNRRLLIALVVGLPLGMYVVFGNRGILQRIRLERQKAELEARIREAEAETRTLQAQSKALDGDKQAIEKVARERYGMVREGETVYKVNRKQ